MSSFIFLQYRALISSHMRKKLTFYVCYSIKIFIRITTNVIYDFHTILLHIYFAVGCFFGFKVKYKMSSPMEAYVAFAT
jgi:hypothetical protein